jgi:serine/threonine-protein kinase
MAGPAAEPAPEQPGQAPAPGEILAGKYRVESVLGIGGMGVVLAVEHIELGQGMAVKLMLPGSHHEPTAAARFLREARAAAALQSEHVVRIFDVGTLEDGSPFMVMELLRGDDLAQVLAGGGPLPIEDAVDYVLMACHAVAEAHGRGIVHRDLKPSNLFLARKTDGSPHVKVLDFGISKALPSDRSPLVSQNLTATSAVMGSPLYMSPEQVRNAKYVDVRSDIWSLGVILFELLTGEPTFVADTLPGICAAIIADPVRRLSDFRSDAPAELEAVIARCLEKDASRRYQTVQDLATALRPFASERMQHSASSVLSPRRAHASLGRPAGADATPTAASNLAAGAIKDAVPPSKAFASHPGALQPTQVSSSGATTPVASTPAAQSTPAVSRRRRAWVLVAAGVAAAAAVVAAIALRRPAAPLVVPPSVPTAPAARATFELAVESTPSGARVTEGGGVLGATPLVLSIDNVGARTAPRRFVVEHNGYLPYTIVQGPSEQNVRLIAPLSPVPSVAEPAPQPGHAATRGHSKPAASASMPQSPAPSPPPPPPSPRPADIRLER